MRQGIGDWEGARKDAEEAVTIYRQFDLPSRFAVGLLERGSLYLRQGAWEEAARDLEEHASLAERSGDLQMLRAAQDGLAEIDLGLGRPHAVQARLLPLLDRPGLEEEDVTRSVLPPLAQAALELGEVTQAHDLALQAVKRARAAGSPPVLADALWTEALVASREGHRQEAERALEEGLALARSLPHPYAEGRLLHLYGALHVQYGEPGPARLRLEAARAIFQQLGARKDLERTEALLATLR
jgi:tetratricopeptide (TPR) repeat protein